jgi:hypothetical protein
VGGTGTTPTAVTCNGCVNISVNDLLWNTTSSGSSGGSSGGTSGGTSGGNNNNWSSWLTAWINAYSHR